MREQSTCVKTGAVKKRIGTVAVFLLLLMAAVGICRLLNPPYSSPPFEPEAVTGLPAPAENLGYGEISAEGGFSFSVVSAMYQQQDGSMLLYLTNPENSGINLMCEIKDTEGEAIYKSGVLRPGEYVERLRPLRALPNEAVKIEVSIYAFEIDTWYSRGTISLANTLQAY